jgi:hypothetical protein
MKIEMSEYGKPVSFELTAAEMNTLEPRFLQS